MRCPICHGTGRLTYQMFDRIGRVDHVYTQLPCSTCGGSGVAHCCDGEDVDQAAALPPGWQEQDARDCYYLACRVIGERVAAGAPLPAYFMSDKTK